MGKLDQKVAIITGGASGIGKKICELFSAEGAIVCIFDVNQEQGELLERELNQKGGKSQFYFTDVSSQENVLQNINSIINTHSRIDILINNAGVAHIGKLENTDEDDFDRIYAINVKGVYNCMYGVIETMKSQKSGVILNMGSIASLVGLPDRFAYSYSKAAVENMSYTVARDYIDYHIRCNTISPARVHTPFVDQFIKKNYPGKEEEIFDQLAKTQPIGRMGRPIEIASLALYLCSDEAAFITGTNIPIDGGFVKLNT